MNLPSVSVLYRGIYGYSDYVSQKVMWGDSVAHYQFEK